MFIHLTIYVLMFSRLSRICGFILLVICCDLNLQGFRLQMPDFTRRPPEFNLGLVNLSLSLDYYNTLENLHPCLWAGTSYRGRRSGKLVREREAKQHHAISTRVTPRSDHHHEFHPDIATVNHHNLITVEPVSRITSTSSNASASTNQVKFCLLNAQSLNNKHADFTDYVCQLQADLVAVTETWFTDKDSASKVLCTPSGYKLFDCPRLNRCGGGTAVFFRNNLLVTKVASTRMNSFEHSMWNIKFSSSLVRLVIVYRPPSSSTPFSAFISEFTELIDNLILCKEKLLIAGDFNIHVDNFDDFNANRFKELLECTGFTQHVNDSTHIHGHTLDLIITRSTELLLKGNPAVDRLFSDHFSIICELNTVKPSDTKVKSSYRKLKSIHIPSLKKDLAQSKLCLDPPDDLDSLVTCYNETLSSALDKHAPLITKSIVIRPSNPWFNNSILKMKRLRRKAERKWRRLKSTSSLSNYNMIKNQTTRVMNEAKCDYYTDFINKNSSDQRKLFKAIKSLFTEQQDLTFPDYPDKILIANQIGDYFVRKITMIRSEFNDDLTNEDSHEPNTSQLFDQTLQQFRPLTVKDTNDLIGKSSKKSCSLDPMPTSIVSNCLDVLTPIITKIINLSLQSGQVPQSWKEAVVHPIPKKANHNLELNNLRPVSNLSYISKLTERAVFNQLHQHMTVNNLYPEMQSSYRKFHSTETALLKTQNDILLNMNNQRVTLLILLDLSAAFDTVDHNILLSRLSITFGISDIALDWFKSYLSDRSQRVSVCGSLSTPLGLDCGVPQGSCLGPLLFIIYSSELFKVINNHLPNVQAFADDTQLYISFEPNSKSDQETATLAMVNCINDAKDWMTNNKLKMNDDKTEFLLIGTRQQLEKVNISSISVGNVEVSPVSFARNLGSWFDTNMNLKTHIAKTSSAAFFHLRNIRRIRKFLTSDITATLIHAFITSKLDYCNSLLYGLPNCQINKLQRIQNAAARLITNTSRFDHITPILYKLHWLPVTSRIQYKIILITFKALHGEAPTYIINLISTKTSSSYSLRSNDDGPLLQVPSKRALKTLGERSFYYAAPKLWNRLPKSIRVEKSAFLFKQLLKTFLFKEYFKFK